MYKLLYIDEEKRAWREIGNALSLSDFEMKFDFIPIYPRLNLDDMINEIIEGDYDAVITDFMLNNNTCDMSYQVDYTGEDIVRAYKKRCCLIPFFVLTAWAENATSEADDINHVYTKSQVLQECYSDTVCFWDRVYKQIETRKRLIREAEERYKYIISKIENGDRLNSQETSQFLQDDSFLEEVYGGKSNQNS